MHDPDESRAAIQALETLSSAEQRFESLRRTVGLFAGPIVFALGMLFPIAGLEPAAARLVPVIAATLVWWITEAVPLPVTALLGPALAIVVGVGTAKEIFAPFGDPIVLFFMGSFVLAAAMASTGLDRRFAFAVLAQPRIASSPARIFVTFAVITAGISAWLNNTATTAMLFPIGLSVLGTLARARDLDPTKLRYGTALMLTLAYASSIGGLATPVGTAPNLIVLGQLDQIAGAHILFLHWMLIAGPIAALLLGFWIVYARWAMPSELDAGVLDGDAMARQLAALGPFSRAERNAVIAFAVTVTGWVLPGFVAIALGADAPLAKELARLLPESVVALFGAALLFVLPVDWRARRFTLDWESASRIDWGTLLLFGGGLSLGAAMFRTGLAEAMGSGLVGLTGSDSLISLTFLFTAIAIVLTEATSNVATATMIGPLAIAAAQAAGVSPIPPAIAVALASSMGSMLPVSTPPNAIVYGSGCIPITAMVRHGAVLDLASALIVPSGVLVGCWLLGLS